MGLLKRSRFDKLNHRQILHTAQSLNWEGWLHAKRCGERPNGQAGLYGRTSSDLQFLSGRAR